MGETGRQIGERQIGPDHSSTPSQAAGKADPDLAGGKKDVEVGGDLFGASDRPAVPLAFARIEIGVRERSRVEELDFLVKKEQRSTHPAIALDALDRVPASLRRIEGLSGNTTIANRPDEEKISVVIADKDRRHVRIEA